MPCLRMLRRLVFVLFIIVWAPSNRGQDLLNEVSVKAGLVVHLGCGDGQLTASLAGNDHIVVQAIDRDSDKIQLARQTIVEQGAYVSVTYGQQTKPVTSLTKESAVKGGLAVLIGCDEKASVMLLHQNDRFLVQALDQEKQKVAATRDYIHSKGLYGKTTANTYNGVQLPFVDNLVNLMIVKEPNTRLTDDEVLRVLAPLGVAYIQNRKITKPWPRPCRRSPLCRRSRTRPTRCRCKTSRSLNLTATGIRYGTTF